jgi:hypothetical protein
LGWIKPGRYVVPAFAGMTVVVVVVPALPFKHP